MADFKFPALFGLLLACLVTGQHVDITPREAVRRVGDTVEVLCKVPYPIDSCRMTVGTTSYRLIPSQQDGDVVYFGQGLEKGECGAHIKNIREEWNGNISCVLPPQSGAIEITGTMRLLVAKPPQIPVLLTPPQPAFKEGEIFTAQCIAPEGRPAAKITWLIDDEALLSGIHQPIITSEPGSDLQTISQNISRTLTAEDNGRTITCRVEQEALPQPREARRQLVVHYPPKIIEPTQSSATIFGLKLNEEGRLNVTVRANPPPHAEWSVGDHRLSAPQTTEDGLIAALEPLRVGGGYYNVTLVLARLMKEDVERSYYLRVSNDLGREEIAVRISTLEEPAGLALETGEIVGIVIAVLVLVIAISLVVFAFATDRWCFAGRRRDSTKSSGESTPAGDVLIESGKQISTRTSDTESAVGGKERSRLAALGARVRAALPRAKDKVQATEAQVEEEDKVPEDKVVYAQLALTEQPSADKPPPPSTEYAEIVYTDQAKENKE